MVSHQDCTCLSHGNAAVEGGFSINKDLIETNMLEETVVAQRVVFYEIRIAGMYVRKVPITAKMVSSVRSENASYKSYLAAKQQEKTEEQEKAKDERKRKALIESLEKQKKLKLDEMKVQAAELETQIKALKSGQH